MALIITSCYFISDINECRTMPCLNNGTCRNEYNNFTCQCPSDWTGRLCEKGNSSYFTSIILNYFLYPSWSGDFKYILPIEIGLKSSSVQLIGVLCM